jgi:indole-3-glycerol phosphate synthase
VSDILSAILEHKKEEVGALRRRTSRTSLLDQARHADAPRGFIEALDARVAAGKPAVIAEVKKASPSKGLIRADFDPAWIAGEYDQGGAACLSVLTDERFFLGHAEHLRAARGACALPALRKDFMIDELQILESRALGADCILLIAAALSAAQLSELHAAAREAGLDVLVEVHDGGELEQVFKANLRGGWLLGINNRSLRSFDTRLEVTLDLIRFLPGGMSVVTESGIGSSADVGRMRAAGVHRFLVGESLMRQPSPGQALRDLLA